MNASKDFSIHNRSELPGYPRGGPRCHPQPTVLLFTVALHCAVALVGTIANMCMLGRIAYAHKKLRVRLSNMDVWFLLIGVCNVSILSIMPAWTFQAIPTLGWILGRGGCVLAKGITTFCFQYSVFLLTYASVERYMAVVHRNAAFGCLNTSGKRRRWVPIVLALLPGGTALFDMCTWTAIRLGPALTLCVSPRAGGFGHAVFWTRILVSFVVPTCILLYCNTAIVRFVRSHVHNNPCANRRSFRAAQSLPVIAFVSFICCWLPWLISGIYFYFVTGCHAAAVVNACTAVGQVYCTTTAVAYMFTANKRWRRNTSVSSQNTYADNPQSP